MPVSPEVKVAESKKTEPHSRTGSLDILSKIDKMILGPDKAVEPVAVAQEADEPVFLDDKVRLFKEVFKGEVLP